jgi:hypothetical protein
MLHLIQFKMSSGLKMYIIHLLDEAVFAESLHFFNTLRASSRSRSKQSLLLFNSSRLFSFNTVKENKLNE